MLGIRGVYLLAFAAAVAAALGTAGALTGAVHGLTRQLLRPGDRSTDRGDLVRRYGSAHEQLQALLAGTALCLLWSVKRHTEATWSFYAGTVLALPVTAARRRQRIDFLAVTCPAASRKSQVVATEKSVRGAITG